MFAVFSAAVVTAFGTARSIHLRGENPGRLVRSTLIFVFPTSGARTQGCVECEERDRQPGRIMNDYIGVNLGGLTATGIAIIDVV